MITVENLHFSYGREPVLCGVDFAVQKGEILTILGPNGCGKSTLLRLLRGVLTPGAGRALWDGKDATHVGRKEMARLAAVVPQSSQAPFPYPVSEMVAMGRYARHAGFLGESAEDRKAVEKALALTDTLHLVKRGVTDLSGGELQRVMLARALAQETPLLLLDEATSHLDLDHRLEITELLVSLNREQGTTVVQVSHDLDLAAEISHRILLLAADGTQAALGSPSEVLTATNLRKVFRVEVKVECNPYTGAPRAYPVRSCHRWKQSPPRIHLLCGGGSGGELLRRLNLAGGEITVGPLNLGDSDQVLASVLELETALEKAFCPFSEEALQAARTFCQQAELLVVAPTVWGPGNLASLDLAREALSRGVPVLLVDPRSERDYTDGKAWEMLQSLHASGGQIVPDAEGVLDLLKAKN
jgi:iron complex transport system ATP-binding protein